ncbi:MAG: enoyl-CoA hydratase/isomerase family protein [Deltaproteobacteria bacterium]|nr:MAG: enoyl-CoA hydratase/isomerase family protein [Deltaproteobacteria bacterium]
MVSEDLVKRSRDGSVVTLTLNDPARRNAMTESMGEAFRDRIEALRDDETVRAVVLTGAGRAFSAGGDLDMIDARARAAAADRDGSGRAAVRDQMRSFYDLFLSLRELPCPSLAAVNGHAVGAGMCLALACDLRIVAREAKFALNFARLGLHPGMGATWTLPRLVGPALAAELLYTGEPVDGERAERIGLANRAVPQPEVLATARALAEAIARAAPGAIRGVKRALRRTEDSSLEAQLDFEAARQSEDFGTADAREGIAAAREGRAPRFGGA